MNTELYSYDKYKDYHIYITQDNGMFYGDIHFNGTCYMSNVKSNSADGCLSKCKDWVDNNLEE